MNDDASRSVPQHRAGLAFRLPVNAVDRAAGASWIATGAIATGSVSAGDEVVALPSAAAGRIARIRKGGAECSRAAAGDAVTLDIQSDTAIQPGDVICNASARAEVASQFAVTLTWISRQRLLKGRPYLLFCAGQQAIAQVTGVRARIEATGARAGARDLGPGETGVCHVLLDRVIAFDAYHTNPATGAIQLADRATQETLATGEIGFALRRAHNIHRQALHVTRTQRATLKGQQPCCLWFTGLSGSGKSTLANLLEQRLFSLGHHTYVLDGDNIRHGLSNDLGFTEADRVENIRRVAEVARLMYEAGLITLVSFISPFRAERRFARERFPPGDFLEIFVDTPLEECERRDPKGLYKKARSGELQNFTGISSPYEPPEDPELRIAHNGTASEADVETILSELQRRGFLKAD